MITAMHAFMTVWTFVGTCVLLVVCYDIMTRWRRR